MEMNYEIHNNVDLKGNQIKDWRGDILTQSQIDDIDLSTESAREAQIARKIYNSTTNEYLRFDAVKGIFVPDGAGDETLKYRGKLNCSITSAQETESLKINPPALANCEGNDIWRVAKSGVYTYINKDGNTVTQKADAGDLFQVVIVTNKTATEDEVLDWMYVESATSEKELIIQYDENNPDLTSWTFNSYATSGNVYDLWKLGYNADMYKEEVKTGAVSGGQIITRTPVFDKPIIIEDRDTYTGKIVYSLKVEFAKPLVAGDKYIVVLK